MSPPSPVHSASLVVAPRHAQIGRLGECLDPAWTSREKILAPTARANSVCCNVEPRRGEMCEGKRAGGMLELGRALCMYAQHVHVHVHVSLSLAV